MAVQAGAGLECDGLPVRALRRTAALAARRDWHRADTPAPSILKRLLKEEGGAAE